MDNEKYTDSLIYSIENYMNKLEYLGRNKRTELRALNSYKILHWLYSWADWYEVSEYDKLKIEELMNCLILRNSHLVLPEIQPQSFYSNVSSPQNMWTWQIITGNSNTTPVAGNVVLTIQATNGGFGVPMTVNKPDILTILTNGVTSFTRTYANGELVTVTTPLYLDNGNIFDHWTLDGVLYPGNPLLSPNITTINMTTNHTLIAVYRLPQPPLGMITINKVVKNSAGTIIESGAAFTVTLSKNGSEIATHDISSDYPFSFANLELGTYTITESPNPAYTIETVNPINVTLVAGTGINQTVTIINKQVPAVGTVTVTPTIYDETTSDVIFTYFLIGADSGVSKQATLSQPAVFTNVALGAYTVKEGLDDSTVLLTSITPNDGTFNVGSFTVSTGHLNWSVAATHELNNT